MWWVSTLLVALGSDGGAYEKRCFPQARAGETCARGINTEDYPEYYSYAGFGAANYDWERPTLSVCAKGLLCDPRERAGVRPRLVRAHPARARKPAPVIS